MKQLADSEYSSEAGPASFNEAAVLSKKFPPDRENHRGTRWQSIRWRIAAGFLICFLFTLIITLLWIFSIKHLKPKIQFLETANNFTFEIQQARRYEKNYFLYGTNLDDALSHADTAYNFLQINALHFKNIIREESFLGLLKHAEEYRTLLKKLPPVPVVGLPNNTSQKSTLEAELRGHGAQMISLAQSITLREKQAMEDLMHWNELVPFYCLAIFFLFIMYMAQKLTREILGPLGRLLRYTKRITQGEFHALIPVQTDRDEFADLIQAMNRMLSELNRRQEFLIQSHKLRAIGTLTAGVAHELNNPINNITLTAHMLRDGYKDLAETEKQEMIQDIVSQAERSQRIIGDLLDFARKSEYKIEPLDLGQLVQETVRLAGNQIKIANAEIEIEISPDLPPLQGDRQQLSQVFLNILLNALDAVDPGGRIWISTALEEPDLIAIKIADNGQGITEQVMPHIFDPFYTTKPLGKGTGLGLAVSQGIIARHGGEIDVASQEGEGTIFTITLPVSKA
jgi:signal transduction histidine kinase